MMEIKYLGQNAFLVKVKNSYLALGNSGKKIAADVAVAGKQLSENDRNNFSPKKRDSTFIITGPGEYEVSGIEVWGGKNNYWLVQIGGWKLCFVNSGWEVPKDKQVDQLGAIDVLFLVLSGKKGEIKQAAELVKRVSTAIIIPAFAADDKTSLQKEFLDAMDREDLKPEDKLKLEKQDLPEDTRLILLKEN